MIYDQLNFKKDRFRLKTRPIFLLKKHNETQGL